VWETKEHERFDVETRDPRKGPTPADDVSEQEYPGRESEMEPAADHGEESYRGSGKLEGLTAIITGGDSGIGRAVAIAFAREGADVAFGYLADSEDADARETRRWVEEAGRRCFVEKFDVREPDACRDFVDRVVGEFGRLDVLVNNAAYQMSQESIQDITVEQLDRTFRTNIYGYIYMVQAALPHLKEGAVILNTGSVTALRGNPKLIDYAATKGAIHVFTKSLATGLSDRGIRVNCIAPGPVWTPLIPSTFPQDDVSSFGEDTFWGRPAQPSEIAPSYVFFASAGGRYYTGEVLAPTGKGATR
jgi:NAD(P)-dependent dehydrogenase (short-subunit alcohol dehydrogenase family)